MNLHLPGREKVSIFPVTSFSPEEEKSYGEPFLNETRYNYNTIVDRFELANELFDLGVTNAYYFMMKSDLIEDIDMTQLFLGACEKGYLNSVKFLLANGVDIDYDDGLPISISAKNKRGKVFEYLYCSGADTNHVSQFMIPGRKIEFKNIFPALKDK
jgi:ankyrin repeat protein